MGRAVERSVGRASGRSEGPTIQRSVGPMRVGVGQTSFFLKGRRTPQVVDTGDVKSGVLASVYVSEWGKVEGKRKSVVIARVKLGDQFFRKHVKTFHERTKGAQYAKLGQRFSKLCSSRGLTLQQAQDLAKQAPFA